MSKIIQVSQLNIANESHPIIKDLSIEIEKGEFVSLTGPTGSGKSTVLKYLSQLIDPTLEVSGEYQLKEKDAYSYNPVELRQTVSYFFQTPSLFGETVRDNLVFPYEIRNEDFDESKAYRMLKNVDLPESYLDKSIRSLSGGERQRVALIRNLMYDPEVLLLDEITSALDRKTREIIWKELLDYRKSHNTTILMISHLDEDHELSDRAIDLPRLNNNITEESEGDDNDGQ